MSEKVNKWTVSSGQWTSEKVKKLTSEKVKKLTSEKVNE
jgi:hypothetical protein